MSTPIKLLTTDQISYQIGLSGYVVFFIWTTIALLYLYVDVSEKFDPTQQKRLQAYFPGLAPRQIATGKWEGVTHKQKLFLKRRRIPTENMLKQEAIRLIGQIKLKEQRPY